MNKISLTSEKRDIFGRKVKTLRKKGLIPANIFGKDIKSEAISVDAKQFNEVYTKAGETQIISLDNRPVLVSNMSIHPITQEILHVDFRQVDLKEKITANVPVEIIGESDAEKQGLGTIVQQIDEVEVEALPTDLPEKIEVNIEGLLEVDQAIYVKDLKFGGDVEVKVDPELIVVKLEAPQVEEVIVPEETTETPVAQSEQETENQAQPEEKQAE